MRYLPHTEKDISEMLSRIGMKDLDDLFAAIPDNCRLNKPLNLPEPFTEWELNDHMQSLAEEMNCGDHRKAFIGAGSYRHFIPRIIWFLLSRSEFYTAYTPYQPEISQGTLQGIFEYQTLVSRLLGLDVSNASMYDGASALAEAALMSIRINKRNRVALSKAVNPLYREVISTYLSPGDFEIVEIPYLENGRTDLGAIANLDEFASVIIQSPNFFGVIEDLNAVGSLTADSKTLFITGFSEPLAYGLLKSPGFCDADIACGEGQSFGIPQTFGGPGLGMFACRKNYMRSMPGRLVGQTVDKDGQRGFVLTLATREQHIRREKATSNICTNQGLCAMASSIYMATLGGSGLKKLAKMNYDKTEYLKAGLRKANIRIPFESPTFNEFVMKLPGDSRQKYDELKAGGIVAGVPLVDYYPELNDCYLVNVTETASRHNMDTLVKEIQR